LIYAFGRFELDLGQRELRADGARVDVQTKVLELLIHLLRHRARVVPKRELFEALWPGVVVGESALTRAMSAARAALGDAGGPDSLIRTHARVGYRFVARVDEREPAPAQAASRAAEGRVVLLAGEAGIGKTRTAQALADVARASGGQVLQGWCWDESGAPPYSPWAQLVRSFGAGVDDAALESALGPGAPELASPAQVVIPAGSLEARAVVNGLAAGATSLVATSALGADGVVVAVSVPVSGQTIDALAPLPSIQVVPLPSAGTALVPAEATLTLDVPLLASPAAVDTPVSVFSSNPLAVSVAAGAFVPQGSTLARVSITSGAAGSAELTLRAGAAGRTLTIFVGSAPPDRLPAIFAAPVGVAVRSLPSAGTAIVPIGQSPTLTIDLLAADAPAPTPVSVTTSDAAVASASGPVVIPAGSRRVTFVLATGVAGRALLVFRVGAEGRELEVFVGPAPADRVPAILAPAVGVAVAELPSAGAVVIPARQTRTIGVELLAAPAAADTPVGVTSSDAAIAAVAGSPIVPAGSRRVELAIAAGAAGNARLVLRAGAEGRTFDVFVDAAPGDRTPPIASPPVCIEIGSSAVRCAGSP
jgi:DNA-binding winged helix-turn-helix (wHTH) protein